ncbi:MAG: 5-(carboxyamino)imidazole ribonucleotide synthase [Smithellaceae bacterium]|nr:5-(carboxyamino)imidazole ribonucleotide synthase [Smithellaceae bacterium]
MQLSPGATIGVIGGGQLGRMLILECRRMGYVTAVIDPDLSGPAAQVADLAFPPEQFEGFLAACQVATYEFEHVDLDMVKEIEQRLPVLPSAGILEIKRNRISEKTYLSEKGFPVSPFQIFPQGGEISLERLGLPLVLKTSTGGYDGKGLYVVKTEAELAAARGQLTGEVIAERFVPFVKEISVMCARDARGNISLYPPGENFHHGGILLHTLAPTALTEQEQVRAREIAAGLAETLGLVGLVGIEMFLLPDGEILINEFAPRPHNSGHFTMDGCNISQFEMLIRVLCGLPLEQPELLCPTAMLNLLGQGPELPWQDIFSLGGVKLHLYGKREARDRRKMGHLNILAPTAAEVTEKLRILKGLVYPEMG